MGVGWIDNIHNPYNKVLWVRSVGGSNHGCWGNPKVDLADEKWHRVPVGSDTHLDWCGINWYYEGKQHKEFCVDPDKPDGIRIYQSEKGGKNWIIWNDRKTGQTLFDQEVPSSDYHAKLVIEENGGFYIEVVNNQWSTMAVINAVGKVIKDVVEFVESIANIVNVVKPKP